MVPLSLSQLFHCSSLLDQVHVSDEKKEAAWVRDKIKDLNSVGDAYQDMAILYRTKLQVYWASEQKCCKTGIILCCNPQVPLLGICPVVCCRPGHSVLPLHTSTPHIL